MFPRRLVCGLLACVLLPLLPACSCGGSPGEEQDGGPMPCDSDGVFMSIYGKARQDILVGETAALKVVLTKRGSGHIAGEYVANKQVAFTLGATAPQDFELLTDVATSGSDGIAEARVRAGQTKAEGVQVTATTGSCNVTFSLDVRQPARRLRFLPPNQPVRDAFTGTRITLTAQASSDDGTALPGETVTFSLGVGVTQNMVLRTLDNTGSGTQLEATTGSDGRAMVRLDTGTEATTVTIRADMSGTAGDSIDLRVQQKGGNASCESDLDCPVGQICDTTADPHVCVDVQSGDCNDDGDCTAPARCVAGKCVLPDTSGEPCFCKPSANLCEGCPAGKVCIAGYCTPPPSGCTTNDDCPIGWECRQGTCYPDYPCSEGCPSGWVCVEGQCQPPGGECNIPNRPTNRLQALWDFESVLHLREAVNPIFGGFLQVASLLQQIIDGTLTIGGIPDWITDIIESFIQSLIAEYVPPWGYELIRALSDINDILNDMRVWSTVQLTNWSPDLYRATERWDLVGFRFRGQDILAAPEDIPEIGEVRVEDYVAREVCGVYYADRHVVKNAVGQLVRWAVEVALTAITCSGSGPCYTTIEEALEDTIDCVAIGYSVNDILQGLVSGAPDVSDAVTQACEGLRTQLINKLVETLNNIKVQLSLLRLRGQALIGGPSQAPTSLGATPPPGPNGRWYGTLAGGNFNGEFKATRH